MIDTVILVEGESDQVALEVLAARLGRDLDRDGVAIVAMGGATTIRRFLELFGPSGLGLRLGGLCDAAEEGVFRRGLERAGLGAGLTRSQMAEIGFFVCDVDLEDELIRALGTDAVEAVIEEQGELRSLRIMQQQPAQRTRAHEAQLRRFLGTRSGRKVAYARALADALDLTRVPRPLECVLAVR